MVAPKPIPWYLPTEPAPAQEQLAHLAGYVQVVDGRDVSSLGTSFDLLPGYHVVQTPSRWAHTELNVGGMYCITGRLSYTIQMRAGYWYVGQVDMEKTGGDTYKCRVRVYENDGQGRATQTFNPTAAGN